MKRFGRFIHQPVLPMGKDGRLVTGCKAHRNLSKDIAAEGTVLLKNDGILPLKEGTKVCPFGDGFGGFLFGGGGSGWVESTDRVSFIDALADANAAGKLNVFSPLLEMHLAGKIDLASIVASWKTHMKAPEFPVASEEMHQQAKAFGGVAQYAKKEIR